MQEKVVLSGIGIDEGHHHIVTQVVGDYFEGVLTGRDITMANTCCCSSSPARRVLRMSSQRQEITM